MTFPKKRLNDVIHCGWMKFGLEPNMIHKILYVDVISLSILHNIYIYTYFCMSFIMNISLI